MKESFWGLFLIILGSIGLSVIYVFHNLNTVNNHDYYILKEITEASLNDALDLGYYRRTGDFKIVEEKFMENFIRRFTESFGSSGNRQIVFYHINEMPPKVSVGIDARVDAQIYNFEVVDFRIGNHIHAIIETKY